VPVSVSYDGEVPVVDSRDVYGLTRAPKVSVSTRIQKIKGSRILEGTGEACREAPKSILLREWVI
jgi:hypothetical protein